MSDHRMPEALDPNGSYLRRLEQETRCRISPALDGFRGHLLMRIYGDPPGIRQALEKIFAAVDGLRGLEEYGMPYSESGQHDWGRYEVR